MHVAIVRSWTRCAAGWVGGIGTRGIVDECTNGGGGGRGGGVRRRRKGGEGGYLVSDRVCVVRKRFYIFL